MVSVIIPAFNSARFIRQAVESVLNQTYKNIEIIVVNDGSIDNTDEICRSILKEEKRMLYFKKNNTGVSDSRNFGMAHASGEYIMFLDSDDYLPRYAVEVLVKEIKEGGYDAVYGNYMYEYEGKKLAHIPRVKADEYTYDNIKERLLDDGTLSGILFGNVWGAIYSRRLINQFGIIFNKDIKVNEDGFFNLKYIKHSSNIKVMTEPYIYVYRQWKNSSAILLERNKELDLATHLIVEYLKEEGEYEEYRKQLICREVSVAFWNALRVKNTDQKFRKSYHYLDKIFNNKEVILGLKYMNYENMNKYKKFICIMMKYRLKVIFYASVRYVYPIMEKIVKR